MRNCNLFGTNSELLRNGYVRSPASPRFFPFPCRFPFPPRTIRCPLCPFAPASQRLQSSGRLADWPAPSPTCLFPCLRRFSQPANQPDPQSQTAARDRLPDPSTHPVLPTVSFLPPASPHVFAALCSGPIGPALPDAYTLPYAFAARHFPAPISLARFSERFPANTPHESVSFPAPPNHSSAPLLRFLLAPSPSSCPPARLHQLRNARSTLPHARPELPHACPFSPMPAHPFLHPSRAYALPTLLAS